LDQGPCDPREISGDTEVRPRAYHPAALRFAYNTNGLAHHRLEDALEMLGALGYQGCGITLDPAHLDPFAPGLARDVDRVARVAKRVGLALAVETGSRYLLDPMRKHHPTLLCEAAGERRRRIDFLVRAASIARDLGAAVVSCWSGVLPEGAEAAAAWGRLVDGTAEVVAAAAERGVTVAFEPEPGMLVEGVADFVRLHQEVAALRLTLDLGHAFLTEADPPEDVVRRVAPWLANVHAEDMRRPVHEHLAFGEGEMRYAPILAALCAVGYDGLVMVELSRDSHRAPVVARAALEYLRAQSAPEVPK
jgi:L-ribulose-5-phosphate 3-epimerase